MQISAVWIETNVSIDKTIFLFKMKIYLNFSYIWLACSPTKASGGMFSNVTGKVSGWLPSSLPSVSMPTVSMPTVSMPHMPSIPGLRKSNPTDESASAEGAAEQAVEAQPSQTNEKDDDDRSR